MILPAIFYVIWDSYFTRMHVWSFNPGYITGIKLAGLPVEEILFFFVVPYCCVFIYECVRCYFPKIENTLLSHVILRSLSAMLLLLAAIFYKRDYTAYTFVFFAFVVFMYYYFQQYFTRLKVSVFLISYAIILLPFLLVNGFLTAIPVVLYNDAENLGIRIYTIPVEDIFYGMLLVFMNVILYEKFRSGTR
jgi:lycopene cyclase domain-containing protein